MYFSTEFIFISIAILSVCSRYRVYQFRHPITSASCPSCMC